MAFVLQHEPPSCLELIFCPNGTSRELANITGRTRVKNTNVFVTDEPPTQVQRTVSRKFRLFC